MSNPQIFLRFLLLIVATTAVVNADSFTWNKGRSLKDQDRYLDGRIPCEDDNILVETGDDPTVLLLDDDLDASSIYFQENGVIYFGSKASIGDKKGSWQCDKNYGVEDAIVKKEPAPAFFDYRNWRQIDLLGRPVRHPKIHAERVPSSDDTAIFPSTKISPVTVGNQVRLSKLFYAGRVSLYFPIFRFHCVRKFNFQKFTSIY
ncbi:unnamed protein product [Bursaphelenchus xylophilus]|uniref:Protein amnionless n=1 Tax=Bursaphelenchus xylophilus TaxID=6326 RepID=A0A1I7RXB0_BURXY|nr:unnamed protein product [Bursaphelenchus xylophilus]CAG9121501.1 unnamed protein product [Bursaphelenchus xylophilus]